MKQARKPSRRAKHRGRERNAHAEPPMLGDERPDHARTLQDFLEHGISEGADNRAIKRAGSAEHDHHDGEAGFTPARELRRHKTIDAGEQRTGDSGDCAGNHEHSEPIAIGIVAERAHPLLVDPDPLQHTAETRAHEPKQEEISRCEQNETDVEELPPIIEVEQCRAADGQVRFDVDVSAVRALGDIGVVKDRKHHLPGGERHHDEIEAARQHGEDANDERTGGCESGTRR